MTTAKSDVFIFFIGLNWLLVGRGGGKIKFLAVLGDSPQRLSRENHAVLKKCPFFFILATFKNNKTQKIKFEVAFSYKDCM